MLATLQSNYLPGSAYRVTRSLIRHWGLLIQLAKRDIGEQYVGQVLGRVWVMLHPLFLMAIYIFVFGFVFRTKIGGTQELPLNYTVYILSGLIPWLTMQNNLARTCTIIVSNTTLVKQVVFPLEVLPVKSVIASLSGQIVSLSVLIIYSLIHFRYLPSSYALIPVIVFIQMIGTIGLGYVLASLSVFLKDLKELVNLYCLVGMFVLPIAYLPQWVPTLFKPLLYLNPLSYLIWVYQDTLFYGRIEHPIAWIFFVGGSLGMYLLGTYVFEATKPFFGDLV